MIRIRHEKYYQFKLAELLLTRERHSEALGALQSGLQHQPDSPWALAQTAFVLEKLGRIDEAIATYEKLCATQQAQPLAYRKLSRFYWSQVRMNEAQAVLEAGIQQHPQHAYLLTKIIGNQEPKLCESNADRKNE